MSRDPGIEAEALRIFESSLDLPQDQRLKSALRQCAGNEALQSRVRSLFEADAAGTQVLGEVAVTPSALDRSGETFGAWTLKRKLAEGGMGAVYVAERSDGAFELTAAVKLLRSPLLTSGQVERFETERHILAKIRHPNIARVLDGGTASDGTPFLAMEFIKGVSITDYVKTHELSVRHRLELIRSVLGAIAEVHRNLIAHRDIKPGNIIVDDNGEPFLLDFGIAKILGDGDTLANQTGTGVLMFTPGYASPEQIRGDQITAASDVYATGLLLYEILTGEQLQQVSASTPATWQKVICDQTSPPPSQTLRGLQQRSMAQQVTGDLDNIVLKALEKDPQRRYASASDFAADIDRYLGGLPVAARPSSKLYRASKFIGRHRWAFGGVAAAFVALSASLIALVLQVQETERQRDVAQEQVLRTQRVNDFLKTLITEASPEVSGENASMMDMLNQASERVDELGDIPQIEADVRATIGWALLGMRRLDASREQLEMALSLQRDHLGEQHPDTALTHYFLGWQRFEDGRFDDSLAEYDTAINFFRVSPDHRSELIDALNDKSVVLSIRGEAEAALVPMEEAVEIAQSMKDGDSDIATLYINLALAYHGVGRLEQADAAYRHSEDIYRTADSETVNLAIALSNHALVRRDLGDLEGAIAMMEESLALRKTVSDVDRFVATAQINLATNLIEAGDVSRAAVLLEEGLGVARQDLESDHPLQDRLDVAEANLLRAQGRYDEAQTLYRSALAALRAQPEPVLEWINGAQMGLARTIWAMNGAGAARQLMQEAERALAEVPGTHDFHYKMARSMLADSTPETQ